MYGNLHDIGNTDVLYHWKFMAILHILQEYWRNALKYLGALWHGHVRNVAIICCMLCMFCPVWCYIGSQKHVYTATITVEVHSRSRSFCCSLNYSGCFFSERQNKLADSVSSAYSSGNTKSWLGTIRDILLFCESLTMLFNRISVDKTVL
jgi:hypothetical protein